MVYTGFFLHSFESVCLLNFPTIKKRKKKHEYLQKQGETGLKEDI